MKRYLHTSEEVIDALKAGKVIRDKDSQWTLRDGFIVRKDANYASWVINDCISSNYAGIYVDEPEPLKLEVGKFYKTRDGRKAIVLNVVKDDTRSCTVRVVVVDDTYDPYFVRKSGHLYKNEENVWDIVAPWED